MSSSVTSASTSAPKSRTRSPSCASQQPLTIANRTRPSAASSTSHAAATAPKPWRSSRPRPPSAMSPFSALSTPQTFPPKSRAAGLEFADAIRRIGADTSHTLADHLSLLLDATGYRAMLRESKAETTEDQLENLGELLELAGCFHTARDLLDHAALATSRPDEDETARVRLMTLHKAKGLEFPHVFLPAWEAGAFPSDYSDRDEERRLAYVALTRGMRRITISHCGFRRGPALPSPFLDDIPETHRVLGWLRDQHRQRATHSPRMDHRVHTTPYRRF